MFIVNLCFIKIEFCERLAESNKTYKRAMPCSKCKNKMKTVTFIKLRRTLEKSQVLSLHEVKLS